MPPKENKTRINLKESKIWQQTVGAAQQIWSGWLNLLKVSFKRMRREEQYDLITKLSQIITIGVSALALSFFYGFIPLLFRVIALPLILIVAWWLGTNIVPQVIINRFSSYLNLD